MRALAALLALVFAGGVFGIAPASAADQRAFLDLTVNTAAQGQALVVLREADVLIRVKDLRDAGLQGFAGKRETVAGTEFVSLTSLRPGLTFVYDESRLSLTITAAPALFGASSIDLSGRGRRTPVDVRTPSEFINYSLSSDPAAGYTAFFETGITSRGRLLYSSFDRDATGALVRGITNLTIDSPNDVRRLIVGDTFASAGELGGTARLAGIGVSRAYDVNPYFVRSATPGLSGTVLTPSTVDVYVNGRLDREISVAPGTFNLNNLPLTSGGNDTRVVIRDAFGREQTIASPYYLAPQMLRRGLTDYSYNLGFKASSTFASGATSYGPASFLGRYQLGVSDAFNAGARLESSAGLVSGGPLFVLSRPFGELGFAAAGSTGQGHRGGALSLSYAYTAYDRPSFGANVVLQSRAYANLGQAPSDERALFDESVYFGVPLARRATLSVRYRSSGYRDAGRQTALSLTGDVQLTQRAGLFVTATHTNAAASVVVSNPFAAGTPNNALAPATTGTTVYAGVNLHLGAASSAFASVATAPNGAPTTTTEIDKAAPAGVGFGYRVQTTSGATGDSLTGNARYQGPFGDYELRLDQTAGGGSSAGVSIAGGIAAVGGTVLATRPLLQSFALVDATVPNVRAYLNNQDVGRTNRNGKLLVPGLQPYLDNQLSIAPQDTPLNYTVESAQRVVVPTYRGGSVVRFPIHRYQAVSGSVGIEAGGRVTYPENGTLALRRSDGSLPPLISDIAEQGAFYVENVSAGRYRAEITQGASSCSFDITVPKSDAPVVKLGTLRCVSR